MGGGPARTRMRSRSSLCTVMFFFHMPLVWVGRSAWYILIVSRPRDELLFITGFVTDRFDETRIIHLGIIQVSSDRIPGSVPRQSALLVCHSPSPLFRGDSLDRTGADLGLRTLSLSRAWLSHAFLLSTWPLFTQEFTVQPSRHMTITRVRVGLSPVVSDAQPVSRV